MRLRMRRNRRRWLDRSDRCGGDKDARDSRRGGGRGGASRRCSPLIAQSPCAPGAEGWAAWAAIILADYRVVGAMPRAAQGTCRARGVLSAPSTRSASVLARSCHGGCGGWRRHPSRRQTQSDTILTSMEGIMSLEMRCRRLIGYPARAPCGGVGLRYLLWKKLTT